MEAAKLMEIPEFSTTDDVGKEDLATILLQQKEFESQMSRITKVNEDALETVFLNEDMQAQPVKVSALLAPAFRDQLIQLLMEFKDIFAWDYVDMKGLDPKFYQHRIHLHPDALPAQQQRYRMNPNVTKQVKEELDHLLRVGFIAPIENPEWISPIVVVPKKNKKLRICVDYKCGNHSGSLSCAIHGFHIG